MRFFSFFRCLLIYTVLLWVRNASAETLDANLNTLQSVGKEGSGNSAATVAWQEVAAADAELIPTILSSIDGDNPLSANWIRAAVDAIASRHEKLPLNDLEVFLADMRHDPRARRLAWELIQDRESERAEEIIRGMLDDPSVELRYDAVDRLIREADREKGSPAATELLRQALGAARDVNQVKKITSDLQEIGDEIDLQQHFGFLSNWYVVGPLIILVDTVLPRFIHQSKVWTSKPRMMARMGRFHGINFLLPIHMEWLISTRLFLVQAMALKKLLRMRLQPSLSLRNKSLKYG